MTQREKLIELIGDSLCCPKETDCADCEYKKYELCTEKMVADYLLANGIIVQEPIRCLECKFHPDYEDVQKKDWPYHSCPMWDNGDDGCGAHWNGHDEGFCDRGERRQENGG